MLNKNTMVLLLSFSLLGVFNSAMADTTNKSEVIIVLKDGIVTPNKIDVKEDTAIVITVKNEGKAAAEFESKALHIEKVLMSGASATFTLKNISIGNYEFVDEFTENQKTAHGVISVK